MKPPWHKTHTYAPRLWLYDLSVAISRDWLGTSDQLPRGPSRDEAVAVVRAEELVDHRAGDTGRARAGFEVLRDGGAVGKHASAAERAWLTAPDMRR